MKQQSPKTSSLFCPYPDCKTRAEASVGGPSSGHIARKGHYFRKEDSKWIRRYRCKCCNRSFSSSRLGECFRQKKRSINGAIYRLLVSGVNQRRVARLLAINRKTVVRKFLFVSAQAKNERLKMLEQMSHNEEKDKISYIHFDEMESFEKSKCLPVSIPLVVVPGTRKILGAKVGAMPAKGPLALISRRKYGPRDDERAQVADAFFSEIKSAIHPQVRILTDQNPKYPNWIRRHLPKAKHETIKGRRGCIVGQGELKKIGWDPLFALNHTAAMIRANISRLVRRTWCTTKRRDRLEAHLELYIKFHNAELTAV